MKVYLNIGDENSCVLISTADGKCWQLDLAKDNPCLHDAMIASVRSDPLGTVHINDNRRRRFADQRSLTEADMAVFSWQPLAEEIREVVR